MFSIGECQKLSADVSTALEAKNQVNLNASETLPIAMHTQKQNGNVVTKDENNAQNSPPCQTHKHVVVLETHHLVQQKIQLDSTEIHPILHTTV